MNPSTRLRFVEREIQVPNPTYGGGTHGQIIRVLQQWFAFDIQYPTLRGEWKDIPTVIEQDAKTF